MATASESAAAEAQPGSLVAEREPNLMRFGLRQLFVFVSAATLLAAALTRMDGFWPLVIGCVALLAAAHVFGTFLGTRLRDTSADVQRWKARPGTSDPDYPVAPTQPVQVADLHLPSPSLASYEKLGSWRHWLIAAGTVAGAVLGLFALNAAAGDDVTWPGLGLGAVSCGVIGAWVSLLGTNFYAIARHTLRQATHELARDQSRR
jgi:hypothetical protein